MPQACPCLPAVFLFAFQSSDRAGTNLYAPTYKVTAQNSNLLWDMLRYAAILIYSVLRMKLFLFPYFLALFVLQPVWHVDAKITGIRMLAVYQMPWLLLRYTHSLVQQGQLIDNSDRLFHAQNTAVCIHSLRLYAIHLQFLSSRYMSLDATHSAQE